MTLSKTQKAVFALIIANIIWGAASPLFKWSLQNIQPFTLAFLRFAIATVLVFPFSLKHLYIKKPDIPILILLATMGLSINIGFFFLGLQFTESINAPVIGSAGPIFVIFLSWIFLKEKIKKKVILGSLIALAGVLLVILEPLLGKGTNLSLVGNLLIFGALMGSIGHVILSKEIMPKYEVLGITFWSFLIATVSFFPFFLYELTTHPLTTIDIRGWTGVLYGGIFCSAIAYFLFYWALKYLPASEVGVFVYLDPIIAIVIAMPLLGESPNSLYVLGSFLVFVGIYIAEGRLPYHPVHKLKYSNS